MQTLEEQWERSLGQLQKLGQLSTAAHGRATAAREMLASIGANPEDHSGYLAAYSALQARSQACDMAYLRASTRLVHRAASGGRPCGSTSSTVARRSSGPVLVGRGNPAFRRRMAEHPRGRSGVGAGDAARSSGRRCRHCRGGTVECERPGQGCPGLVGPVRNHEAGRTRRPPSTGRLSASAPAKRKRPVGFTRTGTRSGSAPAPTATRPRPCWPNGATPTPSGPSSGRPAPRAQRQSAHGAASRVHRRLDQTCLPRT